MTDNTTVEFPEDRVYNECKAMLVLDHNGHISVTYVDTKTGDDMVMVYLGRKEIQKIVSLYLENHEFIDNEGEKKEEKEDVKDECNSTNIKEPTPQPTT